MSSPLNLVGMGMGMGIVHVLTGPDHLSALATLSANVGNFKAFWYGVRWGIGHSLGLIVVGSVFIIASSTAANQDDNDFVEIPAAIEAMCEAFVGVFMLFLGIYGLHKAIQKRSDEGLDEEEMRSAFGDYSGHGGGAIPNISGHSNSMESFSGFSVGTRSSIVDRRTQIEREKSLSHVSVSGDSPKLRPSIIVPDDDKPLKFTLGESSLSFSDGTPAHERFEISRFHHAHDHDHLSEMPDGETKQFISFCVGIVHGIAGPGGVLGVIPAVQLHDPFRSTIYLGTFCITSTMVMGCFAALYGLCSSKVSASSSKFEFMMEMFSSSLSIIVGLLWLFLIYLGKLHDIFP